jgi:hypothetical protein
MDEDDVEETLARNREILHGSDETSELDGPTEEKIDYAALDCPCRFYGKPTCCALCDNFPPTPIEVEIEEEQFTEPADVTLSPETLAKAAVDPDTWEPPDIKIEPRPVAEIVEIVRAEAGWTKTATGWRRKRGDASKAAPRTTQRASAIVNDALSGTGLKGKALDEARHDVVQFLLKRGRTSALTDPETIALIHLWEQGVGSWRATNTAKAEAAAVLEAARK